jgi:hypothetical protein
MTEIDKSTDGTPSPESTRMLTALVQMRSALQ